MAKPKGKGTLTNWFKKENWVDISAPKKVVAMRNVVENLQRIAKEGIQNVCRKPKPIE